MLLCLMEEMRRFETSSLQPTLALPPPLAVAYVQPWQCPLSISGKVTH